MDAPFQGAELFAQPHRPQVARRDAQHAAPRDCARTGRPVAWPRSHVAHPCPANRVQWAEVPQDGTGAGEMVLRLHGRLLERCALQTLELSCRRNMQAVQRRMHLCFQMRDTPIRLKQRMSYMSSLTSLERSGQRSCKKARVRQVARHASAAPALVRQLVRSCTSNADRPRTRSRMVLSLTRLAPVACMRRSGEDSMGANHGAAEHGEERDGRGEDAGEEDEEGEEVEGLTGCFCSSNV